MTIEISDIQLFTLLKAKIGEKEATAIIEYVKQEAKASSEKTSQYFTKDLDVLQIHLDLKLEQTKTDMYKAMFVTGLIQLLAILGGVLAIVKFIK